MIKLSFFVSQFSLISKQQSQKRRGFTLIELMVTITIIAVIASIGFVTYSKSQLYSRDAKRKQDLRAIAVALEFYHQSYDRYPCPSNPADGDNDGDNEWVNSGSGVSTWINDDSYGVGATTCGDTSVRNLDSNFITELPKDPVNSGNVNPWGSQTNYTYAYRGYHSACAASKKGQFFLLVAQLENKTDPERQGIVKVKDCQDTTVSSLTSTAWDTTFVISSD